MTSTQSWKENTVGEIVEFYDYKRIPLSGNQRQKRQGPYPYYGASGIIDHIDDFIFNGKYLLIAEDGENLNSRNTPIAFFAKGKFWVNNHAHIIRAIIDKADDYFLKAWFDQANISGYITGAAQPKLSQSNLRRIKLLLPPLPIQRKIAAILSAYDDLIENNTRRINILEQMAQAIYREWFVHFRFPGHEHVKLVDSGTELGMVPEGWEVKPIGEVIEILGGGTPSTQVSDYWENGDINWFCPKDLTASGTMFMGDSPKKITPFGLQKSSARMFPAYSVMMTSRATLGVTSINTSPACTNQGFITCVPNEKLSVYQIYFWIADNLEKIISVASGATFKEITKTTFRKFLVILAPKEINDYFIEQMTPLGKQIENLQSKNSNLRVTRDLLLPRLLSGELDVSELEIPTL